MVTRARWGPVLVTICVGALAVIRQAALAEAADDNKACGLATAAEIESVVGLAVTLNPTGRGKAEFCTGQAPSAKVLLRLTTGLDPGRDRSGGKEKAGLDMMRKLGAQADMKTFGPIVCSTFEPPPGKEQMGFNTTCTVSKDNAVAGIEITATGKAGMVPIDKLRAVAEKMAGRF